MLNWNDIKTILQNGNPEPPRTVEKTNEEWKKLLNDEEFHVTRLKGTERPFSSEMCSAFEDGLYACVCCGEELFESTQKFESNTGWPSFTQPLKENLVAYKSDNSLAARPRVEILCNVCDAHLGHVFPDGPEPSGLRYCVNAVSLKKVD